MATYDYFISYVDIDTPWAEWIAQQLESAGHRVSFRRWDFVPGSNFVQQMAEHLEASSGVMAVVTPAYLASAWSSAA